MIAELSPPPISPEHRRAGKEHVSLAVPANLNHSRFGRTNVQERRGM
jgi:hypothetical protein